MIRAELGSSNRQEALDLLERLKARFVRTHRPAIHLADFIDTGNTPKQCTTASAGSWSTTR